MTGSLCAFHFHSKVKEEVGLRRTRVRHLVVCLRIISNRNRSVQSSSSAELLESYLHARTHCLGLGDAMLKGMEGREITPCSTCGSLIGVIPDPPPKISSVDSPQLESMARSVVYETEQRIADLQEIKRQSLETHQLILRRLEEYHSYAFYHESLLAPIRHFPPELLSEIFIISVTDSASDRFSSASRLSTLRKVCRRWRDIAHTTPRLWNRPPHISARSLLDADPSCLQIYFTLARDLPLSIDVYIDRSCVTGTPMLKTLITHSEQIGELKVHCEWRELRLLSGMSSRLRNLRTLELTTTNSIEDVDTAIFSIAPQLRDVCFMPSMPGYQLSRLGLPWTQLKTVTFNWPDLDYAWMVLSKAPHMEMCTFIQVSNVYIQVANIGNPRGIVRHTGLKGLSLKKDPCGEHTVFPALLFDNLVLPNLNSLLVQLNQLTIDPIIALIARSGCRLIKLALNTPLIKGSLMALLVETPSLTHLEVHFLWPTDISGLTIDKNSKNEPIAPHLRVIHVRNPALMNERSVCLSLNTLIRSRVDSLQSIQDIRLDFNDRYHASLIYGQLRGIPWTPSRDFGHDLTVEWAQSLRELTTSSLPKDEVL
jgi:hypothetical protein